MSEFDRDDYLWNPRAAPDPDVVALETALRPLRYPAGTASAGDDKRALAIVESSSTRAATQRGIRRLKPGWGPIAAVAAALLLVVALAETRRLVRPWAVVTMQDKPGWIPTVQTHRPLAAGEWIVTDATTRARLNVGSLGRAEIGPSSRVRLVRAAVTEHRLALAEGKLRARIWAPPRFFLVETAAALAVDLGCVYTLEVDRYGAGYLRVESGEVELVGRGMRARVPAGNTVRVNASSGPGLPFPDQASSGFVTALTTLEEKPADPSLITSALAVLLREATPRTTITLWHLLPRIDTTHRALVVDRLAGLAALPAGVERTAVMRLDPSALEKWRASMELEWSSEPPAFWKRWWRSLWRARGEESASIALD